MWGSTEAVQAVPHSADEGGAAVGARQRDAARKAANAVSSVAWIPQQELQEHEWLATGRRLGAIGRGSNWWLGDWIRHGAARWGDRFSEAARATGYDRGTLRTMAWIASRVPASVRNEKLTWDHHVAVASLEPEQQAYWLERAATEGFSVSDLKLELRARRTGEEQGAVAGGGLDARDGDASVCPSCGHSPWPRGDDAGAPGRFATPEHGTQRRGPASRS